MDQRIASTTLLVKDYDAAIRFYTESLGFVLIADEAIGAEQRWVQVRPQGAKECGIVFIKAQTAEAMAAVGKQAAGQVLMIIQTDNFTRDYERMQEKGVEFLELPRQEVYGKVAIFSDLYGNLFDLLEPTRAN
ncbi:MAG: VOC family protein [Saprospiraceae bacterium]|nr:VOC family protein [Saprospiraceae bacterium]